MNPNPKDILFYSNTRGEYKAFSNFYPAKFEDDQGNVFYNSEQYFMYHKALLFDPDQAPNFLKITKPAESKAMGRRIKGFDEKKWNEHKFKAMTDGIRYKFSQNLTLKGLLMSTIGSNLYEASPTDAIWGIGFSEDSAPKDKKLWGQNFLGLSLMKVRDEFISNNNVISNVDGVAAYKI